VSRYYRTTSSGIGFPPWTPIVKKLVIACVITWVVQLIGGEDFNRLLGLTPLQVTQSWSIWQLGTYIFLHDTRNITHILFNMLGLWMFGSELEQMWGPRRFLKFFFICGVGAGILMVLLSPSDPRMTIGASGSVYGVLLAFAMLFPNRIIYYIIFPIPAKYFAMIMGGMAFFSSMSASSGGIAHVAHLGGMLCGFLYMKKAGWSRGRQYLYSYSPRKGIVVSIRERYAQWQRARLRKKFEVYYNERHRDDDPGRRWKN
jgi:membrane associated rhomboid family serine protease